MNSKIYYSCLRMFNLLKIFEILNNSPENKIFWLSVCRGQNRNGEFSGSLIKEVDSR